MAISPTTAKILITLVKKALTDKKIRRRMLIAISIPLVFILVILSSPFAILFSTTEETVNDSGKPVTDIMNELHNNLVEKIEIEQDVGDEIDEVKTIYMGSEGETIDNRGHVLALFSIDSNMIETQEAEQVASLTKDQVQDLKDLYWSMNEISTEQLSIPWDDEEYPITPEPTITPAPMTTPAPSIKPTPTITQTPEPYTIKNIYVTCLSYQDVLPQYNFSKVQVAVLEEMMSGEYGNIFFGASGNVETLSEVEIQKIRADLPVNMSIDANTIKSTASSLVGNVSYFWGGKYNEVGRNPEWDKKRKVTSPGSKTTGTDRPYGLDCSGYVSWVFINSGFSKDITSRYFGSGTHTQWDYSIPVNTISVRVGDLAFRSVPGTGVNHVGVVVGRDSQGELLVTHCSSSKNGVVITPFSPTFKYLRRPVILLTEDEEMP